MRTGITKTGVLLIILSMLLSEKLMAQPVVFQLVDVIDMPSGLNPDRYDSCRLKFREQWTIDPSRNSISKEVDTFKASCAEGMDGFSFGKGLIREAVSYEFFFMDAQEVAGEKIQEAIIALIRAHYPANKIFNLPVQLLSVCFHEEWFLDAESLVITKKVKGITPVIWQQRQTADHEPVNDAETGLPVYFKVELQKIDLR